jgi:hypothetical protein
VTTFKVDRDATPEDWLLRILYDVDLHHGHYSHDPPYTTIEVFGTSATPAVRSAFADYGEFILTE